MSLREARSGLVGLQTDVGKWPLGFVGGDEGFRGGERLHHEPLPSVDRDRRVGGTLSGTPSLVPRVLCWMRLHPCVYVGKEEARLSY